MSLTVQRYSEVAAQVSDAVDTKIICYVCHPVGLVRLFLQDSHRPFVTWPRILVAGLGQVALEDLHQAVGVAVVMDGATFAWRPDKDELDAVSAWQESHDTTRDHHTRFDLPFPSSTRFRV